MIHIAHQASQSPAGEYLCRLAQVLDTAPREAIQQVIALLLDTRERRKRVYVMGNGGSASTASHLACDLIKTARVPGLAPLRVFALADNAALLTALANDTAYDRTFAEQIYGHAEEGDVVIAISASGNSPNVVEGLKAASELGAHTVALVGFDGGLAAELADITIHIPTHDYGLVEDSHSAIGHAMTAAFRQALLVEGR
jgi:D-sedoheptulose 7-phosphate isomerase